MFLLFDHAMGGGESTEIRKRRHPVSRRLLATYSILQSTVTREKDCLYNTRLDTADTRTGLTSSQAFRIGVVS